MVEAIHVAYRLAPPEHVLTFLAQGLGRQKLSVSALKQRSRLPLVRVQADRGWAAWSARQHEGSCGLK
jgi:hypothetical protein